MAGREQHNLFQEFETVRLTDPTVHACLAEPMGGLTLENLMLAVVELHLQKKKLIDVLGKRPAPIYITPPFGVIKRIEDLIERRADDAKPDAVVEERR